MASATSDEPMLSGWQVACYAIVAPFVYFFEQQIYEAMYIVGHALVLIPRTIFLQGAGAFFHGDMPFFPGVFFALAIIAVGLILVVAGVVVMIPGMLVYFLATNPGPLRDIADIAVVWLLGTFLYGTVFPLLWLVLAPLLAHTVGEITYQQLRESVFGDEARLTEPLYLIVALVCIAFGVARSLAPTVQAGEVAWHNAREETFNPPVPTPNPWPKRFEVPAKQTVRTGIMFTEKDQEIYVARSAHVFLKIGEMGQWTFLHRNWDGQTWDPKTAVYFSLARTGEVLLFGGDENAVVFIGEPTSYGRHWLAPGETLRVAVWTDAGTTIWWCGGDQVSLRTVRDGRPSSQWSFIGSRGDCESGRGYVGHTLPDGAEAPGSGFLEVKAGGAHPSWFNFLSATPKGKWFHITAGQALDTGVPVRPGDDVNVTAGAEPIYWLSSHGGEFVIPANQAYHEIVSTTGTVRLKGGLLDSGATVTVLARGQNWK